MNSSCCFRKCEQSEDAAITARRMLQAVAEAHSIDQHDLHVTTSIGVSVYPDDGLDAETLIKNADTAMYQAKENGRQSYQFFKPAMNVRAVERQSIEESLRRALERQEFALHYQPKINLRTGAITGAEALLRWTHPTRGPVSPAQFIPVAEDCGLILPIGNWVLREACEQARAWVDAGLPADDHGRERLRDGVSGRELSGRCVRDPRGNGPGSEISRAGADRERSHEARRVHGIHPPGPEGKRGAGGDRRLRHRLLQLELSAKVSDRCPQDRPVVRPSDHHRCATIRPS